METTFLRPEHSNQQTSRFTLFAWPRWSHPVELRLLCSQFASRLAAVAQSTLVLYAHPEKDGTRAECEKRFRDVLSTFPSLERLNWKVLHHPLNPQEIYQLRRTVSQCALLPSSMMADRNQLFEQIARPLCPHGASLHEAVQLWRAAQRGMRLVWQPSGNGLPVETSIPIPQTMKCPARWFAKQLVHKPSSGQKRLAIIVPFRNRETHLAQFAPYLNDYLGDRPFDLFVMEQGNDKPFNRGKLLNIGFDLVAAGYDYFAFHDVDHFPVDADYDYPIHPIHLAARSAVNHFELLYETCMGGIVLFNTQDFKQINGFSNAFWGWGAEDDDLYLRMQQMECYPSRRQGIFDTLPHESNAFIHPTYKDNLVRLNQMKNADIDLHQDGLTTLQYRLTQASKCDLYYRLTVDL